MRYTKYYKESINNRSINGFLTWKKFLENVTEVPFFIFGSETSQDYDVLIQVNEIPKEIDKAHNICKYWNEKLSTILSDKPLNCNLGIIENGKIIKVFKGTSDELQNALFYTYDLHKQYFPNPIKEPTNRDIDQKIIRVARFIISFYSRTYLRPQIKSALRGDLKLRLGVLKEIDFTKMTKFPKKDEKIEDIYKVIAFQWGQIFSLLDGHESESYTKNGIIKNYPDLANLLLRKNITIKDLEILNKYKEEFQKIIENRINKGNIKLFE